MELSLLIHTPLISQTEEEGTCQIACAMMTVHSLGRTLLNHVPSPLPQTGPTQIPHEAWKGLIDSFEALESKMDEIDKCRSTPAEYPLSRIRSDWLTHHGEQIPPDLGVPTFLMGRLVAPLEAVIRQHRGPYPTPHPEPPSPEEIRKEIQAGRPVIVEIHCQEEIQGEDNLNPPETYQTSHQVLLVGYVQFPENSALRDDWLLIFDPLNSGRRFRRVFPEVSGKYPTSLDVRLSQVRGRLERFIQEKPDHKHFRDLRWISVEKLWGNADANQSSSASFSSDEITFVWMKTVYVRLPDFYRHLVGLRKDLATTSGKESRT